MVTPRQRRTQKSGKKNTRRTADKRRKITFKGNEYVKANWNKKETLIQNYRRLGLLTNLNGKSAGGVEVFYPEKKTEPIEQDEDMTPTDLKELTEADIEQLKKTLRPDEGLIQRDDEGNIIQIITGERPSHNDILDAPIVPVEAKTDFVRGLEAQANVVRKGDRHVASSEQKWLEQLTEKHGDDYQAMFWDQKLNTNQLTVAQIKKRFKNYEKTMAAKNN
ncbi:ribosome biogenesis protein Nop16 [Chlamydoabsidia padenii]|nr:ribosome biogenesis protein Nop16 [Chlamydoabsidia padenii]